MFSLSSAVVAAVLSVIAIHTDRGGGGCGCGGRDNGGYIVRTGCGGKRGCGCGGDSNGDRGCGCGRG